jgi:hypothetical protein
VVATIIAGVGAAVAIGALLRAVFEYRAQGRQRRAEHFLKMMERFNGEDRFRTLCDLLDHGDEAAIGRLPWSDRRDFLGFAEEVAILMNSKLIPERIAYYMFGYYPLRASESPAFMGTVNPDSPYWVLFFDFVNRMASLEASPPSTPSLRF